MAMFLSLKDIGKSAYISDDKTAGAVIAQKMGFGYETFINKRQIAALEAPAAYLTKRNDALAALGKTAEATYTAVITDLTKVGSELVGMENEPFVKSYALKIAELEILARKAAIDLQFPLEGSNAAVAHQKKLNKLDNIASLDTLALGQ
jgi:hypothetical protein